METGCRLRGLGHCPTPVTQGAQRAPRNLAREVKSPSRLCRSPGEAREGPWVTVRGRQGLPSKIRGNCFCV